MPLANDVFSQTRYFGKPGLARPSLRSYLEARIDVALNKSKGVEVFPPLP